jgi:hypothetical protein
MRRRARARRWRLVTSGSDVAFPATRWSGSPAWPSPAPRATRPRHAGGGGPRVGGIRPPTGPRHPPRRPPLATTGEASPKVGPKACDSPRQLLLGRLGLWAPPTPTASSSPTSDDPADIEVRFRRRARLEQRVKDTNLGLNRICLIAVPLSGDRKRADREPANRRQSTSSPTTSNRPSRTFNGTGPTNADPAGPSTPAPPKPTPCSPNAPLTSPPTCAATCDKPASRRTQR